jgi:hypothetical protein
MPTIPLVEFIHVLSGMIQQLKSRGIIQLFGVLIALVIVYLIFGL